MKRESEARHYEAKGSEDIDSQTAVRHKSGTIASASTVRHK